MLQCVSGDEPPPEALAVARRVHYEFYAQPQARARATQRERFGPTARNAAAALTLLLAPANCLPPAPPAAARRAPRRSLPAALTRSAAATQAGAEGGAAAVVASGLRCVDVDVADGAAAARDDVAATVLLADAHGVPAGEPRFALLSRVRAAREATTPHGRAATALRRMHALHTLMQLGPDYGACTPPAAAQPPKGCAERKKRPAPANCR